MSKKSILGQFTAKIINQITLYINKDSKKIESENNLDPNQNCSNFPKDMQPLNMKSSSKSDNSVTEKQELPKEIEEKKAQELINKWSSTKKNKKKKTKKITTTASKEEAAQQTKKKITAKEKIGKKASKRPHKIVAEPVQPIIKKRPKLKSEIEFDKTDLDDFDNLMLSSGVVPLDAAQKSSRKNFSDINAKKFEGSPKEPIYLSKAKKHHEEIIRDIEPEDSLDLHGKTRDEALKMVGNFINFAHKNRYYSILIITGKGKNSGALGAVLPEAVWSWLNRHGKKAVRNFDWAPKRLGGTGAILVFLK